MNKKYIILSISFSAMALIIMLTTSPASGAVIVLLWFLSVLGVIYSVLAGVLQQRTPHSHFFASLMSGLILLGVALSTLGQLTISDVLLLGFIGLLTIYIVKIKKHA